jgi:hypothetical protein
MISSRNRGGAAQGAREARDAARALTSLPAVAID